MSIHAIKFAVIMLFALVSVFLGSGVGEGPVPILIAMGAVFAVLWEMRCFDRIVLGSKRFKLSDLFSSALSSIKSVKHGNGLDVIETSGGRYLAVGGVEVLDVWNTFEVLRKEEVISLSRLHGELVTLEGVEVQVELAKRGKNPRIRYYVLAHAKTPDAAVMKARAALEELEKGLHSIQVAVRRLKCGGDAASCELTRLERGGAPLPVSRTIFIAQLIMAFAALFTTMVFSPGAVELVACVAVPSIMGGVYNVYATKNLGRSSGWSPTGMSVESSIVNGRLMIGGSINSFAALKRIEHYDRFLGPDDIYELVSQLNDLLYSEYDFLFRISLRRIEEAGYARKQSLAMDVAWSDFESGAGLSRKLKSHKHEVRLERIRVLGERPFRIAGVLILRSGAAHEEAAVKEAAIQSRFETLGMKLKWVRGASQISKCIKMLFLGPSSSLPVVEEPGPEPFESLTMDFGWLSPIALDRSPLLAKDGIYLGRDRRGRPVYWNPVALRNAHMGIYGPPGSGKSTLVRSIILRAMRFFQERYGYRPVIVIIDPAGEYRKVAGMLGGKIVDMTNLKVNPLLLEGASPHERASKVAEMFRYILALKGEEKVELKDAILEAYQRAGIDPTDRETWSKGYDRRVTMRTVYEIVREKFAKADAEGRSAQAVVLKTLMDKMRDLCEGARALDRTDITVTDILSKGHLLCLSFKDVYGAVGMDLQRVIVWTLLEQLRDRMLADEVHESCRVLVIIDEGHRFVQVATLVEGGIQVKVEPPLSLHLRDVRKFGVGYIFVTHRPNDMPEGVSGLMGTTIALSSTETEYLEWAERELRLTPGQIATLERAGLGRGYMIWMDDPRPLFVAFEPEREALVRDAVAERMRALLGEEVAKPEPAKRGAPPAEPRKQVPRPVPQPAPAEALGAMGGGGEGVIGESRLEPAGLAAAERPPAAGEKKMIIDEGGRYTCPSCGSVMWEGGPLPSWYKFCTICGAPVTQLKVVRR